jgi:hypothetical protein
MTDRIALPVSTLGDVTATGSNTINVMWSAVANASGYRVEYATDAEFIHVVDMIPVDSSTTSTDITAGIRANTTYFVRVIAIGTGDYIELRWLCRKVGYHTLQCTDGFEESESNDNEH